MKGLLSRLGAKVAPAVCPRCEGGSGMVLDRGSGALDVCDYCHGSGRADDSALKASLRTRLATGARHRTPRPPRSAA